MSLFKSEIDHALFFDDDDLYINFDRFKPGRKYNICFIVGYAASGKTTLSFELSKKHKAELLNLDAILYPPDTDWLIDYCKKNYKTFYEFIKSNPKYIKFMDKYLKVFAEGEKPLTPEKKKLIIERRQWRIKIVEFCMTKSHKMILEGVDLYPAFTVHPELCEYPIIIKGTSKLKAMYRYIKRDIESNKTPDNILDLIEWFGQQSTNLNNFRIDMRVFMK